MAKVVKNFKFTKSKPKNIYPWDEWLDGRKWQIAAGEDFTCSTAAFVSLCYSTAKKRGLKLTAQYLEDHDVVIQAFERGDDA